MHISTPRPVHRDVAFRYHLKNRFNPNYAHDRIVQIRVRRGFLMICIGICLFVSACASLAIWFLTKESSSGDAMKFTAISLPCLLLGALAIRLVIQIHKERVEEKLLVEEVTVFEERYQTFLNTVGLTPVNLDPLSDKKIERLCEDILGTEAQATAQSTRTKKAHQKRLIDVYEAVTRIGYGKKALEDYLKRAKRRPRTKKAASRHAHA